MKIKNTRELVLRAQGHARADHIKQGTYGSSRTNGKTEFTGCAITCLAAPSRLADLRAWIKAVPREGFSMEDHDEHALIRQLGEEFGICESLARLVEIIFESLDFHGEAINFIPQFAKALVEGSSFTDYAVWNWAEKHGVEPAHRGMWEIETDSYYDPVISITDLRDQFLAWVSARRPR